MLGRYSLTFALTLSCSARTDVARAPRPQWRVTAASVGAANDSVRARPQADASVETASAQREARAQWQCSVTEVALPSVGAELDVPSASIYSDAVVGASLIVRERRRRGRTAPTLFDAELHFRNQRGPNVAQQEVIGVAQIAAPWRIEDGAAAVLRRCNLDGECEVFALGPPVQRFVLPVRVREDDPVFALRAEREATDAGAVPSSVTVIAVQRGTAVVARVIESTVAHTQSTGISSSATLPEGASLVGVSFAHDELGLWIRRGDGPIEDQRGAPVALSDVPCTSSAAKPFAVVVQSVTLGAFGPRFELRAEVARESAERTCVTRLYGRADVRLVPSSIDVDVRGVSQHGLMRTARAVHALRCVATNAP